MKIENVCALALALDLYKSVTSKVHPFSLYITLIEKKDGRLYICRDQIERGEKFCHNDQDLDFNYNNIDSKIITNLEI